MARNKSLRLGEGARFNGSDKPCVWKECDFCGNQVCTHYGCEHHKPDCRWATEEQKQGRKE